MDSSDHGTWIVAIGWAAVTIVLIVVTLTFDPLWSYYASFAAGIMTSISTFKTAKSQHEQRRLDLEDEILLLEVRHAKAAERNEKIRANVDSERRKLRPGGDAAENS